MSKNMTFQDFCEEINDIIGVLLVAVKTNRLDYNDFNLITTGENEALQLCYHFTVEDKNDVLEGCLEIDEKGLAIFYIGDDRTHEEVIQTTPLEKAKELYALIFERKAKRVIHAAKRLLQELTETPKTKKEK